MGAVGGVATRTELIAVGVSSGTIANRVRTGEWQRPFPAVFLLFPGVPSWEQRLACVQKWVGGRGVFSHQTAAYLHGLRKDPPEVLDITVPQSAGLRSTPRCTIHRPTVPSTRTGTPQRTSLEQTVVDLVDDAATNGEVLDVLIAAIQTRLNPTTFVTQLSTYPRVRNRELALRLLEVTDEGVESHLELEYRRRVERAHGLPRAVRQKWERIRGRWIRSDCWYPGFRVRVELDGELAHPGRATDADVMRDNDVLVTRDEITLRYRWPHVHITPCDTAGQVGAALRRRGWRGRMKQCSPGCRAVDIANGHAG